ncbi:MAG: tetratricopeptide repeat protein [Armatimonadetes bacterium]|nr:tetratricopeptide repeat protein [Armatimonadota bacterium]
MAPNEGASNEGFDCSGCVFGIIDRFFLVFYTSGFRDRDYSPRFLLFVMKAHMNPDEIRKHAEFERIFRAAHVSRTRGNYEEAEHLIRQALSLRPNDSEAREFAADLLAARGELEEAAEEYKSIFESDPSRTSAEEKFAKVTIQIAEARRQRELLKLMVEQPEAFRSTFELPPRSPFVAALFSGVPGLGHIYCGKTIKGIALFLTVSISWLLFFALRPSVGGAIDPITRFVQDLDTSAVIFLCLAVFTHVYAFVDAAVTAEQSRKDAKNLAESSSKKA